MTESPAMNIALVAPSPVPLAIGGAENLWWGLLEHLNRRTEHHADLIKLPTPEQSFWEIVDSYRRWSELDVSGYDAVVSGKYPAWMVEHPRHICYLLHPLRGLYDTYPPGWPLRFETSHGPVASLVNFLDGDRRERKSLPELWERLDALRERDDVPPEAFALPGPLIRQVVHHLDRIGRGEHAVVRNVALSATVAGRTGYFPPGADVPVAHAPTWRQGLHTGRGRYLFTVSRLDGPKRIDLLIRAMEHVKARIPLLVGGTGPQAAQLHALAAGDPRITLSGFLNETELADAYAGALAVLFAPYDEDYGYITLEAMLSGKPVITTTDAGGPIELVEDGVTGLIVAPEPVAIAAAIDRLVARPRAARRMGGVGLERARGVTWDHVVATLLDGINV